MPFEISEVNYGFQKAKGLMKVSGKGIELEFEVKDAILGVLSSGIKNVTVSYSDLESIAFKGGWFSSKVILEGVSMQVFEEVPGTEVATCELKIKRKDRDEARDLISKARLHLSEYKLERLDGEA